MRDIFLFNVTISRPTSEGRVLLGINAALPDHDQRDFASLVGPVVHVVYPDGEAREYQVLETQFAGSWSSERLHAVHLATGDDVPEGSAVWRHRA